MDRMSRDETGDPKEITFNTRHFTDRKFSEALLMALTDYGTKGTSTSENKGATYDKPR